MKYFTTYIWNTHRRDELGHTVVERDALSLELVHNTVSAMK